MVELLSPVAGFPSLVAAIESGADSVYFGIDELNMRVNAKNFGLGEIAKVVKLCHGAGVRAYFCLNTIIYEAEAAKVRKILAAVKKAGIDAVICWDFAVLKECNKLKIPIHLSTQASVSNSSAAEYYVRKFGVKRIVLARECSIDDINKIKKKMPKLEIECFVHGAMCVSVSGRCFLSEFEFGRSANRGDCLQPCRRDYIITDEEGKKLRLGNNYVLSPKDICALPFIDKLIKAGVDCFKLEGRNRSPEYVKVVTEAYRRAIDAYLDGKLDVRLKKNLVENLKTVYNRGFSSGFFLGKPVNAWAGVYGSKATKKKVYVGYIDNFYKKVGVAEIKLEARGIKLGERIMVQGNATGVKEQKIADMEMGHKKVKKVKKGEGVGVKLGFTARKNDKVFVIL